MRRDLFQYIKLIPPHLVPAKYSLMLPCAYVHIDAYIARFGGFVGFTLS